MATSKDKEREDAKFLIDQFNKFAAWRMAEAQFEVSQTVILTALIAIALSAFTATMNYVGAPTWLVLPTILIFVAVFIFYLREIRREYKAFKAEQINDADRLLYLEDHYSRFESLPHITLWDIIDFKPEDLWNYLRQSEPSATGSPRS
jgi:hypothetical protein